MSNIVLTGQGSAPLTPTSGKVRVYVGTDGILRSVDSAGTVTTYSAGITQEQVEDYVGNLLADSSSVNVTYNDAGNVVTFDVIAGGVDHDALLNFVANEHINHSSVNITAGTGLSGGGDITASRTLNIANTGVSANTYGNASTVSQITVNAQGQITAANNVGISPTLIGAQPVDADLTALAGLTGSGLVVRTGAGTATTRTITAGTGVSVSNGDGVSGNPTVGLGNTGVTAATYGSATQVPQVAINAQGQATSASNVSIAIPSSQVTDFNEAAQDAIGGILTDTASIDFTYNDAGSQITAAVLPAGVDHDSLLNFVANEHINHSSVSINAGTYISSTGLGDITASRTINHANSAVTPATYGGVNAIPVLGIGATGHVDSATTVNPTAALLTGLATGTDTPILSTNTLLVALANLQAQIDASISDPWTELCTSSTYNNTSTVTGVNISELAISVVAGRRYYYEATLLYETATAGTGIGITMTSPDGATADGALIVQMANTNTDGTGALWGGTINSLGDYVTATGSVGVGTRQVLNIKGTFPCDTSGTFNLTFRSESGGNNVAILPSSTVLLRDFG